MQRAKEAADLSFRFGLPPSSDCSPPALPVPPEAQRGWNGFDGAPGATSFVYPINPPLWLRDSWALGEGSFVPQDPIPEVRLPRPGPARRRSSRPKILCPQPMPEQPSMKRRLLSDAPPQATTPAKRGAAAQQWQGAWSLHVTNIAQTVGGAWVAENIGADHAAINRIDEVIEGINGTSGEVVIGEKGGLLFGSSGSDAPSDSQRGWPSPPS